MRPEIEKLGAFYLGKEWDITTKQVDNVPFMVDSKDFVTHAVCMGMTGSGKTGLCISLLEEAAIDGIPAIVIDPKGDISNLALTFPALKGEDFLPWINPDDARKKGMSETDFANSQANLWKNGLKEWWQDGERIKLLKQSASVQIYTPGSTAGQPLSILKSMDAPSEKVMEDADLYADTIASTVTGILSLLSIDADPLQSREHILLSSILDYFWKKGESPDLVGLVTAVQSPPITKIGIFDLDTFYPVKERFKLAMSLNNLLASPKFQVWTKGTPLDIDKLLYTKDGKPKISIISIAHLEDKERMFTVSLLLNRLLNWMRSQSGTTSLRALLYMDEIFGYLPPVSNPPTKKPLLTLLKQARAFGLGLVLATQNPVDLDYKGLSNTGIWFIGRLQTDRDKARVLDGLSGTGLNLNRGETEQLISSLDKRVFLMHNVHEEKPVLFHTRWVMSYLRGPLTREQIKKLKIKEDITDFSKEKNNLEPQLSKTKETKKETINNKPPLLPPDIKQVFMPIDRNIVQDKQVHYFPAIVSEGCVYFTDRKTNTAVEKKYLVFKEELDNNQFIFEVDKLIEISKSKNYDVIPYGNGVFDELPSFVTKKNFFKKYNKQLKDFLYKEVSLKLYKNKLTELTSKPFENEAEFSIRVKQKAREIRDYQIEKLKEKYSPKIQRLQERIEKAEAKLEKEELQAKSSKIDTAISIGATIFSMFTGRKRFKSTTISRAGTSMRRAGRISKEAKDVEIAKERLENLTKQLEMLKEKLENEVYEIRENFENAVSMTEVFEIKPKKINTSVLYSTLCWVPYVENSKGRFENASLQ